MHRLYVLGLLFAMSFVSSVPRAHAANSPTVILSEIAWAGSASSTADEWIELANVGTESVLLGGWQLTGVGTSDSILTIPADTLLNAGSAYLISNYALGDPKSTLGISTDLVTTAVSVPNTTLNITLIDSSGAIVDSLIDPGTPDAGSSTTFASMERDLTDLSWASAETSTNLLNGQLGSPGVISHIAAIPVEIADPEGSIAEPETPPVTEPVVNPEPEIFEEPAEEPIEIIADPITTSTIDDPAVPDVVAEIPVDTVLIEPLVVPEIIEAIETPVITPVIEAVIVDAVPVVDETSNETAPISEVPLIEETPVIVTESTSVETPATEATPSEVIPTSVVTESGPIETIVPDTSTPLAGDEPEIEPVPTIHVGDLVISGVYPSPNTGDDEWVAVTNATNASIDLTDITLLDGSGTVTALEGTIEAQATIYILNPKGKLNNDGDSVTLIDSTGAVIGSVTYGTEEFPAPKKGTVLLFPLAPTASELVDAEHAEPYEEPIITATISPDPAPATDTASSDLTTDSSGARTARTTVVATTSTSIPATHSAPNIATRVISTPSATTSAAKKASTTSTTSAASSPAPQVVSIDDIDRLADDVAVTIEGVVVSVPGAIGKRSFFLNGLEIYQSQGDLALVSVGDHVRVTGTVSVLSDHRRVNIKAGGVTILGVSTPIVHEYIESLQYGSLVRVTGTVNARDGNAIVLLIDDTRSVTVTPATGITVNWTDLAGKTLTVTGILKNANTPSTIVLRNAEDITVMQEPIEAVVAGTSSPSVAPWMSAGAAALVAISFGAWAWRHRPQSSLTKLTLHPTSV